MANALQINAGNPIAGLGTFEYTNLSAGFITVDIKTTLPLGSALQILIKKNGSTLITLGGVATNPTPTQLSMGGGVKVNCAAADVIGVVLSSANAVDALPNAVKSNITLYQGE